MHDPMSMIGEWPRYGTWLYRLIGTQFTLWHRDPESDGTDDSCGWPFPKLSKEQRKRLRDWAWFEGHDPYFLRCPGKQFNGPRAEAECLYRALILDVARCLRLRISLEEATRWAIDSVHSGGVSDGARLFCYLPGYHTNFTEDTAERRQDHFTGIICSIARELLCRRRPWYRHPRWHIWHWRLRIRLWQKFYRAWFERCSKCGKGYSWGYVPMGDWSCTSTWHQDCENPRAQGVAQQASA